MMIKLYTGSGCSSSRRAKRWLIVHDIPFIEQNLIRQPLTKNEFIHLLKIDKQRRDRNALYSFY